MTMTDEITDFQSETINSSTYLIIGCEWDGTPYIKKSLLACSQDLKDLLFHNKLLSSIINNGHHWYEMFDVLNDLEISIWAISGNDHIVDHSPIISDLLIEKSRNVQHFCYNLRDLVYNSSPYRCNVIYSKDALWDSDKNLLTLKLKLEGKNCESVIMEGIGTLADTHGITVVYEIID
jgi:hypothetical protein